MFKSFYKIIPTSLFIIFSGASFAQPSIDNNHGCIMRNFDVVSQKGEKIQFDLIRITHDVRGEVFLKIKTQEAIGDFLLLYINSSNKPDMIKVTQNGAFIPLNIIRKIQAATSIRFLINMKKGSPLVGDLNEKHFEWMRRFGKTCS